MNSLVATPVVVPMLLGIKWLDPEWLQHEYGAAFIWIALAMVFVECGLFFPFLPGDTLLFALGLFIAGSNATGYSVIGISNEPVELVIAMALLIVAAFAGNVSGYEIGRKLGPPLYQRDGRILKKQYFDKTSAFFEKHGNKALVIGRFVPFVRTYITVVAGVTMMERRRFFIWSAIGAVLWVISITLLGYFLGAAFPCARREHRLRHHRHPGVLRDPARVGVVAAQATGRAPAEGRDRRTRGRRGPGDPRSDSPVD